MTNRENELGPIFGPPIPISRDARGRIKWVEFKETPGLRVLAIEQEARRLLAEDGNFTQANIRVREKTLVTGIQLYYPGQFTGLRVSLGLEVERRPNGYWTKETIEQEAAETYARLGTLSQKALLKDGNSGLSMAIASKYPGKMRALRTQIGLSIPLKRDYWTPEQVEKTAQEILAEYGDLSRKTLIKAGRLDFANAMQKRYPGGSAALAERLDLAPTVHKRGHWTVETIESDIASFIDKFGSLSYGLLERNGYSPLSSAIVENYPGGIVALKEKFGIAPQVQPPGYWTAERVEEEARKFLAEHGTLTHTALQKHGMNSLSAAMSSIYPGGTPALRTLLGLSPDARSKIEAPIPKEEANAALDGLFEGGQND